MQFWRSLKSSLLQSDNTHMMDVLILVFLLPTVCCGDVIFIQLLGYGLLADTFETYSTSDATECVNECAANEDCLAVQMVRGTCNLLNKIRAYTFEEAQCSFFIKNATTVTVTGRSLSPMDQVIQNVVYASHDECPDGWTVAASVCTLQVSEEKCDEYASFLGFSYNNDKCTVNKVSYSYSCPKNWTYGNYDYGHFCHKIVPRFTETYRGNMTYVDASKKYCKENGGYFATIHSQEEQDIYGDLRANAVSAGLAIGLITQEPNDYIVGNWSMIWYDDTDVNYSNWGPGPELVNADTDQFKVTLMTGDDQWHTNLSPSSVFTDNFIHVACKADATVTMTTT